MALDLEQTVSRLSTGLPEAPSEEDLQRAQEPMSQRRLEINKPSKKGFNYKDANAILAKVSEGTIPDATPALVQALFTYNASVSFARFKSTNIWKIIIRKNRFDIRSRVLEQAVRTCSESVVLCLAQNADSVSLTEALPLAISLEDPLKTYILLQQGADTSQICDSFGQAIENGSDDMVRVLTKVGKGGCQRCRDEGLVQAATLKHLVKTQILLESGADVAYDNASALLTATRSGSDDIVEAIASHMEEHPVLLDIALGEAYTKNQPQLLSVLLRSGAKGSHMNEVLAETFKKGELDLAQLLVSHDASIPENRGECIRAVVKSGRPDLLQLALQSKPTMVALETAIPYASKLPDLNNSHQMIEPLLAAGVRGKWVVNTLLWVLERTVKPDQKDVHQELLQLLLQKGEADVNFQQGRCFTFIISQGRTDLLDLFMKYGPTFESVTTAMEFAMGVAEPELMLEIVQTMIGGKGGKFNPEETTREELQQIATVTAAKHLRLDILQALAVTVTSKAAFSAAFEVLVTGGSKWLNSEGLTVAQLLLEHGASGPAVEGAFSHAVNAYDHQAIDLLLEFVSGPIFDRVLMELTSNSRTWQEEEHLSLVETLLERVCQDESVNKFLGEAVAAFSEHNTSEDLIDAVFSVRPNAADVNYNHGEPLVRAVLGGSVPLLSKLAESGATPSSMMQAFHSVIRRPMQEGNALAFIDAILAYLRAAGTSADIPLAVTGTVLPLSSHVNETVKDNSIIMEQLAARRPRGLLFGLGGWLQTQIL